MKNNQHPANRTSSAKSVNAREHTKHVAVRDDSGYPKHEEPLSAYMISPQYLPRTQRVRLAPKRPLGQSAASKPQATKEPVKMYSQVATFGDMSRIRRPRTQHIEVEDRDGEGAGSKLQGYMVAATTAIGAAIIFSWDKIKGGWHFVADKYHSIHFGQTRVSYSAAAGAAVKRFGVRQNWLRISAPVVLLLFLLGMGLFAGLFNNQQIPGIQGGAGGSNGGSVLQVEQSVGHGSTSSTSTGSPQLNSTTSGKATQGAGGSMQVQPGNGQLLQYGSSGISGVSSTPAGSPTNGGTSTGSAPIAGGMGGGDTATPTGTSSTAPSSTTSTPTQSPVTVTVPVDTNVPTTTTVTVPPATVDDGSGKPIVSTGPTPVTVN